MSNVLLFLAILVAALVVGAWLSARAVAAFMRADQQQRCDAGQAAINSEADRAERDIFARWRL